MAVMKRYRDGNYVSTWVYVKRQEFENVNIAKRQGGRGMSVQLTLAVRDVGQTLNAEVPSWLRSISDAIQTRALTDTDLKKWNLEIASGAQKAIVEGWRDAFRETTATSV